MNNKETMSAKEYEAILRDCFIISGIPQRCNITADQVMAVMKEVSKAMKYAQERAREERRGE